MSNCLIILRQEIHFFFYCAQFFKTNFLNFYQVINAIPKTLLTRARNFGKVPKESYLGNQSKIQLAENIEIDLEKAKAKDFYWLLNNKVNHSFPTGPTKWSKNLNLNSTEWGHFFKSTKRVCKENKLKEFHYKFLQEIHYFFSRNYSSLFGILAFLILKSWVIYLL